MARVLVVATSRKTRGGIASVLNLYERSKMWEDFHCHWIPVHRDGNAVRKLCYLLYGFLQYVLLLPFYDIVHIHFSLSNSAKRKYPFFRLAKCLGKITVIHLHCGSQIDEIWSPVYQRMFEQCDCGVLLSESLRKKIEDHIGESNKLRVIYNPCPIVTEEVHYSKQNHVLFSGTLYEGKGYLDLIRAFGRVAARYPNWKLIMAGNGEVKRARVLATKLGIENQVYLLGWVSGEQKHRAFCEAKALCLPSYAEGFPMAVLDAWAYGLPVLTTPVGGVSDVAIDGINALLFNPGDVNMLSLKLEQIILDGELRERLAQESTKMATGPFSLDTVTRQVSDIYESLVRKS